MAVEEEHTRYTDDDLNGRDAMKAAGSRRRRSLAVKGADAARMAGEEARRLSETGMEMGRKAGRKWRRMARAIFGGDKALWTIIIALLIFSMLLTFSATVYKPGGTPTSKLFHQIGFIVAGITGLLLVHIIPYRLYGRAIKYMFPASLVLTIAAIFIGLAGNGAMRDIRLPFGVSLQPFELLKICLIMMLALQLSKRQKDIERIDIMPSLNPMSWVKDAQHNMDILVKHTIPVLGPVLITCIVTLIAVGNSTTLIIAATCLVMLYIGRVKASDLAKIIGLVAVAGILLFYIDVGRSQERQSRVASFQPDMLTKHVRLTADSVEIYDYPPVFDAEGNQIKAGEHTQSISAKMSIASGGFFGKGPGMSTHRSNLAEAERDFAYAFIIEEYGALGGLLVLLLYLWLFFRTIQIFKRCGKSFPSLLVLGLGLMIALQAMIHMLVSVSLFPITGQQLPLISKGGSSLVFTLMALGMILGVSRQTAKEAADARKAISPKSQNTRQ